MPLTKEDGRRIRADGAGKLEKEICEKHNLKQIGGSRTKIDGSDGVNNKSIKNARGSSTHVHLTTQNKFIEHIPHIDYDFKHKGAIYCLNTCNGHTNFMGEKVDSVFNRMILFNPTVLHNSTTTTDKIVRMNINFNYYE